MSGQPQLLRSDQAMFGWMKSALILGRAFFEKFSRRKEKIARVCSVGLTSHPVLQACEDLRLDIGSGLPDLYIGWGRKASGLKAVRYAGQSGKDFILVEDGFLRSAGREDVPVSIVRDTSGIYYDASTPSRLEELCLQPLDETRRARARSLQDAWVSEGVSKYNAFRESRSELPQKYVLVVDQVAGDSSVRFGGASAESFKVMLEAALEENPDCQILLKTHPDFLTRGKGGHYCAEDLAKNTRITVVQDLCHPVRLIRHARKVYVVTSQIGFEALLHGRPVRCFGMPFYAGWGLTEDEISPPDRRSPVELEALIHAALVDYPVYVDPVKGGVMRAEDAIAWMGSVRRMVEKIPEKVYAVGFSAWKRQILRRFCRHSQVIFCDMKDVPAGETVIVWGMRDSADAPDDVAVIRVEDGFMRSRGLGADLTQPYSWSFDSLGIHFNPTEPSDLENMMRSGGIARCYLERARALRKAITEKGVSKYNLPGESWKRPKNRRVVLVVGQVEDDASILAGSPVVRRNVDLLRAVREMEPGAWIVYKPHPDVVSGLRRADADPDMIARLSDEVIPGVSLSSLVEHVDSVHVMTSQAGFEFLLRGISVTCHGNPFYAGWGLTEDILRCERGRKCSIDELVAAALILYPSYSDPKTGFPITPEQTIDFLTLDSGDVHGRRFFLKCVRRARSWMRQKRDRSQHDEGQSEARSCQKAEKSPGGPADHRT
jgi:capsular polysaccharide export protein